MNVFRTIIKDGIIYLLISLFIFLMLRMIVEYYPFNDHSGFLELKQDYINNHFWKTCFYIHVFTSIFVLMAGLTQFSAYVLKKHRSVHKFVGKMYAGNILFINFPCALVMGIYANGGFAGKTAFLLLDILWFLFTLKAVKEIKKGNIIKHKQFMIRSYALTLSAISLRTWKIILINTTSFHIDTIYIMDAWLGFLPNLLLAEWLIRKRYATKNYRSNLTL